MKQPTFLAALKFVSHAMAKRDVRSYLNGVLVEIEENQTTLVATDGYRLAVAVLEGGGKASQIILKTESVKSILSAAPCLDDVNISVSGHSAALRIGAQVLNFEGIEAKYPDWRRVCLARPEPTELIGFNSEYMAQAFAALSKVANRKHKGVKMHLRGPNSNVKLEAGLAEDFPGLSEAYCIIVPMRL